MSDLLSTWQRSAHADEQYSFPTYRKGSGPGVIIIHEIPGLTPQVIGFAEEVVAAGYTVVMPHLFGTPGAKVSPLSVVSSTRQVCVNSAFTKLATGETTPMAGWLRSLARELHAELGGPGVGALGMCFTGGFALAMMVEDSVAAPVLCQPSTPFPVGARRAADLNVSENDMATVRRRAAGGCPVLGLRFTGDPAVGTRFETLTRELGDSFRRVEMPGRQHGTVTINRRQEFVDAVMDFFDERLRPAAL